MGLNKMNTKLCSVRYKRAFSTLKSSPSSKEVRKHFLEYFLNQNNHQYVKSSPVVSYFDSSIPFVNSGMCQFKNIFTGNEVPLYDKVANSQKCIRLAGKQNDLQVVGTDSYHHTFFEMLGNWFFKSYDQKLACKLAWQLLTSPPFSIPENKLFVSYFGGDEKLQLPPDNEVKEIWLELGVPRNRILPFGVENFWEMGFTGVCGPCTEIHVALSDKLCSSPHLVNKNNPLLTELWNIVFIKYNRNEDNSMELLPNQYIDTGMGFERLVSVLQGKISNYDTDLFCPLLKRVSELCGTPEYGGTFGKKNLDESYRLITDFTRMVTVAISDNCFPDSNSKLKRVLRKSLLIAEHTFNASSPSFLITELSKLVAENLQETFPEIGQNFLQVKYIIENEEESLKSLQHKNSKYWKETREKYPALENFCFVEYPGLPPAYPFLLEEISKAESKNELPPEVVFKLFDTYGLETELIKSLTNNLGVTVNWKEVEAYTESYKKNNKSLKKKFEKIENILNKVNTDDSAKYAFHENNKKISIPYTFAKVNAVILAILEENEFASVVDSSSELNNVTDKDTLKTKIKYGVTANDQEIGIIVDTTNFYTFAGGQCHDTGTITVENNNKIKLTLNVHKMEKFKNAVIHYCYFPKRLNSKISAGNNVTLKIDEKRRYELMQNHTASHLLLSVIKDTFPVSYYRSGLVSDVFLDSTLGVFGKTCNVDDFIMIENKIKKYISNRMNVEKTNYLYPSQLNSVPEVSFSPGEIYPPNNLQLVSVLDKTGKIISRELCCGTHLSNTHDIKNFRIIQIKTHKCSLNVRAVTGNYADFATDNEINLKTQMDTLTKIMRDVLSNRVLLPKEVINKYEVLSRYIYDLTHKLADPNNMLPYSLHRDLLVLKDLKIQINELISTFSKDTLLNSISSIINDSATSNNLIIYASTLEPKSLKDKEFLFEVLSFCKNVPTLLLAYNSMKLSCISFVPQEQVTENFNSETWLHSILETLSLNKPKQEETKNSDYSYVVYKRISEANIIKIIDKSSKIGKELALSRLEK